MPRFNILESQCADSYALKRYSVCAPSLRAAKVVATKKQAFSRSESYIRIRDEQNKLLACKANGRWFQ